MPRIADTGGNIIIICHRIYEMEHLVENIIIIPATAKFACEINKEKASEVVVPS